MTVTSAGSLTSGRCLRLDLWSHSVGGTDGPLSQPRRRPRGILFIPIRLYFGWEWIQGGWEKVQSGWLSSGKPVAGFAVGALKQTGGEHPPVAYGWWVSSLRFLRDTGWASSAMAWIVTMGELVIGVALILGIFTGIVAALGATLNFAFMFSGSAGVKPAYLLAEVLLIAAWRVAGQVGADFWLLDRASAVRDAGAPPGASQPPGRPDPPQDEGPHGPLIACPVRQRRVVPRGGRRCC